MALLTVPAVSIETAGQNEPLKTSFLYFFLLGIAQSRNGEPSAADGSTGPR